MRRAAAWLAAVLGSVMVAAAGTAAELEQVVSRESPVFNPAAARLTVGRDGMLYITTGDAASPNPPDPFNTGQDISDLLS